MMENSNAPIELYGDVAAVIFQNAENGYSVIKLDTPDGQVTAVGCMPGVCPGETLELTGSWTTHSSFGTQFKVETAFRRMPDTSESIFRYLASGAVKGIGPKRARDIVDAFGRESLEVLESAPQKLAAIAGISERAANSMSAAFRRQIGLRRLTEYLIGFDIEPYISVLLYRDYGDHAYDAVRDNPYLIVSDPYNAEFFRADAMAISLGLEADCPQRVEAAVLFELTYNLNNGHVFLPHDKLAGATDQLIGVGIDAVYDAIDNLCDAGDITRCEIAGCDGCYLTPLYDAESAVAHRLRLLSQFNNEQPAERASHLVAQIERDNGITYAPEQREAITAAICCRALVLTGGPGTGKTTSLRGILSAFDKLGLKTALCAPTGRAAKRMSEVCSREASTIHRLLGVTGGANGSMPIFDHDDSNPIDVDAVIVDETSMVDIMLMHSLMQALREETKLILVGDADQLPSVGAGNVLSDIIRSGTVCTVYLKKIFRQAQESRIISGAHLINAGKSPDIDDNRSDFFFLKRRGTERTVETIAQLCAERLPKNMGIDPDKIQVLSPAKKQGACTAVLNKTLQAVLNPAAEGKKEKTFGEFSFREGDRVMQIKNNYDIMWKTADGKSAGTGVYNGDIGKITEINTAAEVLLVDFEDKLAAYTFEQLGELELAYAATVHKSQGSEYNAVILALSGTSSRLMARNVLYTAVTRARDLLIIVGEPDIFNAMIASDKRTRRYSGLRARLVM